MSINYAKLRANLNLARYRLRVLIKHKVGMNKRARREIVELVARREFERASIRVEHIIREQYRLEAMEIVELYCDLLLTRSTLIQQMNTTTTTTTTQPNESNDVAVASLLWATQHLKFDVPELSIVEKQLKAQFGKSFVEAARTNSSGTVNHKLIDKLSAQALPPTLVQSYVAEVATVLEVQQQQQPNQVLHAQPITTTSTATMSSSSPPQKPPRKSKSLTAPPATTSTSIGDPVGGGTNSVHNVNYPDVPNHSPTDSHSSIDSSSIDFNDIQRRFENLKDKK